MVSGPSHKKTLTTLFVLTCFFFILFYRGCLGFSKVPEEVLLFPGGGGQLFPGGGGGGGGGGGSNFFHRGCSCLFPIDTHITCDFRGGSGSAQDEKT